MSQRPGWLTAVLLVGVTNLAPLAGWWWNRTGDPMATVDLSQDEAAVQRGGKENSSVWLRLQAAESWVQRSGSGWADSTSLAAIGFDPEQLSTGEVVPPAPRDPHRRPAWILLQVGVDDGSAEGSRLVPLAVGTDPGALYRLAPDRTSHLVMRGVVRLGRERLPADSITGLSPGESWSAGLDLLTPGILHVPRTLVPVLVGGLDSDAGSVDRSRYLVRVVMGRFHLPRVTGIFPAAP